MSELTVNEQQVIVGDKGISFKYYHKKGNKKVKIIGKEQDDGSFLLITIDGDKKEQKTLSKKELIDYIKKDEQLAFALNSIKAQKGGKRGSRKGTRKASKKGSRKASRKGSRKGSKKGSKGGARGGSRKGSRPVKKY